MLDVPWSSGSQAGHAALSLFLQIAETYAFLPREAVTRFLMSCTECQKRMHFNSNGLEPKGKGNGMALAERAASRTRHHQRAVGGCPSWDVSVQNVFPNLGYFQCVFAGKPKELFKTRVVHHRSCTVFIRGSGKGLLSPAFLPSRRFLFWVHLPQGNCTKLGSKPLQRGLQSARDCMWVEA